MSFSRKEIDARYNARHPEANRLKYQRYKAKHPEAQKLKHLRRKYNLTLEQYQALSDKQCGLCAICKLPETMEWNGKLQNLVVDHDHDTNEIRGLLCRLCNAALGRFKNVEILQNAVTYLEKR